MQVTTVLGSPREKGNTATVLELFEKLMTKQGHKVDRMNINKKFALVTVAAENGFELHNELLSRWLRCYGAQIIGDIELYAWEKNDLVHDRSQIAKLKEFAFEIMGEVN